MILRNKHPNNSTTLYNVICSLNDENLSINEKINNSIPFIFNFDFIIDDFNINSKSFVEYFKRQFILKYINNYFSTPTFELFQLKLEEKTQEILPLYALMIKKIFLTDFEKIGYNVTFSKNDNNIIVKNISSNFPEQIININSNNGSINYANDGQYNETESKSNNEILTGNNIEFFIKNNKEITKIFTDLLNEFQNLFSFLI